MTEHHAQTFQLVDLPELRTLSTSTWAWTDAVRTRRLSELTTLTRSLRRWHEAVPETGLQHADEGKHVTFPTTIPGVINSGEIDALHQLTGRRLAATWLRLFIQHEEGAVHQAAREIGQGHDAATVAFAHETGSGMQPS